MHLRFEELSMNAWPALQTVLYDGWVLRFSDGYTRGANSINPIYSSAINPTLKIDYCENLYLSKGLSPIYKLTPTTYPEELDYLLDMRGYTKEYETALQVLNLADFNDSGDNPLLKIETEFSTEWINAFIDCSEPDVASEKHTMSKMLKSILVEKLCAQLIFDDEIVACGFCVIENGFAGLFDIIVRPDQRGKGYGKAIVLELLREAKKRSAKTAYLQVMLENTVAKNLYHHMGFRELYRYWYRIKAL